MKYAVADILKGVGLKVTPTRSLILGVFAASACKPINADELYHKLASHALNLVTIYRTLESFEKAGILKRVDLRKGSVYYELAEHHHHHIVCTECGKTESFEACEVGKLSKQILKQSSFKNINQHALEFFGVCRSCARE
jgi:Fe2+ or Zn2+ uptake regulation protein